MRCTLWPFAEELKSPLLKFQLKSFPLFITKPTKENRARLVAKNIKGMPKFAQLNCYYLDARQLFAHEFVEAIANHINLLI